MHIRAYLHISSNHKLIMEGNSTFPCDPRIEPDLRKRRLEWEEKFTHCYVIITNKYRFTLIFSNKFDL
ncbi:hypothetical protein ANTRET_LOCUS10783 [Anthophora retusa]